MGEWHTVASLPFFAFWVLGVFGSVDKYWGGETKNIKNSLLPTPVLRTCR